MKPIEIKITGHTTMSTQEICAQFLDTQRWSEFEGHSILPGVKNASFELKTPALVGSRIKVLNTDGSAHVEEIIQWDVENGIAVRFQEFQAPLKNIATHFIEAWEFQKTGTGTQVTRRMTMYPKGLPGWFMLAPISILMKKSFEKNMLQLSRK